MAKIILYGFDGSTYVRTVRMLLAEKGAAYEQVPVHVLKGEPREPEHLARHPFGKVPVLDYDDFRIIETSAIGPYLDEVLPGPSFTPDTPKDRARMHMAMGIIDSYGYGALIGVAGYHLFPDFVGGPNEAARRQGIMIGKSVGFFGVVEKDAGHGELSNDRAPTGLRSPAIRVETSAERRQRASIFRSHACGRLTRARWPGAVPAKSRST
jgi:hypothetical protein